MGEGKGVAGRVGVRRQAVSLECVVLAEHLSHHVDTMFQFETGPKDVRSLPYNYGHWFV